MAQALSVFMHGNSIRALQRLPPDHSRGSLYKLTVSNYMCAVGSPLSGHFVPSFFLQRTNATAKDTIIEIAAPIQPQ